MGRAIGLPFRAVSHRPLSGTVFDMISCRRVLNIPTQRETSAWTASETAPHNKRASVALAVEGIRIHYLPRTTRHAIPGCCPTW